MSTPISEREFPTIKNLKMLDEIHSVVMKHSYNRELANAVRESLSRPKWTSDYVCDLASKAYNMTELLNILRDAHNSSIVERECQPDAKDTERIALNDVLEERKRQDTKWGEQNHAPIDYLAILVEEVGEFAQAALHLKFGGPEALGVRSEAVQIAAVALAIVECLDRAKWEPREHALACRSLAAEQEKKS